MSDERRGYFDDEGWYGDDCNDFGDDRCETCGGEGFVEYIEHPELWGEDCPSLKNHLLTCPECGGNGFVR
jgi:hypothetical protein